MNTNRHETGLTKIYERLLEEFGPRGWWPGETAFEVIIGAILTQNTSWENVEKAINSLKSHGLLTPLNLHQTSEEKLARHIKSAGHFNVKARRVKNFVQFLFNNYNGDLQKLRGLELSELRRQLLAVNGIGPETADSILLYAFEKPIFVVDAYTRRMFSRHNLIPERATYSEIQAYFMDHLPRDVKLYNEFHALIVHLGKRFCKPKPDCESCPINCLLC